MTLLPECLCGSVAAVRDEMHDIPVLRCTACGIIRQDVALTEAQLGTWYHQHYHDGPYQHSYDHDRQVAQLRLKAYRFAARAKVLDVGCGNAAFVNEGFANGIDIVGQDLAVQSNGALVHVGPLEDVAFPTQSFDAVTVHDVLEHAVRPQAMLAEIARIVRPGGRLIVDFPRFFHEAGVRHWKRTEHLWMFREAELIALIEAAGFRIVRSYNPIASKVVIDAVRREETRPSILVPAGIGDAYWVLVKLPGFLKHHGLPLPDVFVQDSGGPKRTQPFLQTIPFVHAAGYKELPTRHTLFHEAYMLDGRTVFERELGVDYFIAYNGILRAGHSLEETDKQYGCDWFPRMHFSKAAQAQQTLLQEHAPYVVAYFPTSRMYDKWLADFPLTAIEESLQAMERALGAKIVLVGAEWDLRSTGMQLAQRNPSFINLISKTTYDQLLGTLKGAHAIVGWPSGATLLGPTLKVPTVLMWNAYFKEAFWRKSVAPGQPYWPLDTAGLKPMELFWLVSGLQW